jgi:hypothetical protein
MRLAILFSAVVILIDPGCLTGVESSEVIVSSVLIVLRETPLVLAVSSNSGLFGLDTVMLSMLTGIPLILTPDEEDDDVLSIDTLTRISSSSDCKAAWAKRKMSRFGAVDPGEGEGACPTKDDQIVEADSSPFCDLTRI